jgi:hypothetical protein
MKTITNTEKQMNKISIECFVKDRVENNKNGYLGATLKEGIGRYKETAITNIQVDANGDYVYIFTDNFRVKKSAMKLSQLITINY